MTREPTEMERRGAIAIATLRVGGGDPQVGAWVFERMSARDQADYHAEARAVIRAMREPTEEMKAVPRQRPGFSAGWYALIDAASPPEGA